MYYFLSDFIMALFHIFHWLIAWLQLFWSHTSTMIITKSIEGFLLQTNYCNWEHPNLRFEISSFENFSIANKTETEQKNTKKHLRVFIKNLFLIVVFTSCLSTNVIIDKIKPINFVQILSRNCFIHENRKAKKKLLMKTTHSN